MKIRTLKKRIRMKKMEFKRFAKELKKTSKKRTFKRLEISFKMAGIFIDILTQKKSLRKIQNPD